MTADPTSLLPHEWDSLAPLLDRLLDTPASQRAQLFAELAAGDAGRRAELERLVAECERALPLLDRPAVERFDRLLGDEPEPPLPEVLGGRYRIERELGRGGMARVYLAQDLKHSRPVAVKVIRPELAASLGRERFLREIGIAARLRHPSIMPLFDSGDANGLLYFVMPFEDGLSLRARLQRDGQLSTPDAVSILRDVARALAYAHDHGVVHRDVKPDNVLLSGDAAVVTDFGIAKAYSVALTETGAEAVTQAGGAIGTPAYMAPEQALGDPATDHRADLYSFGCLAYEVFAGTPPFAGSTSFELIGAQMAVVPTPISERRADVPAPIAELIARCLEKDPASRPQSAGELLEVLGAVSTLEPVRRRRLAAYLAPVLVVILAVLGAWYVVTRGGPVTVAVLPFQSVGGDSTQAAFAEGFSADLATALVSVPWVRVMSRQGAGNYSGEGDIDPRATGKALGARYLVMATLRQVDGRQTVTVRLVSSENESVLWADMFDRPAELRALRDQIVTTIGDSLRSRAGSLSSRQVATRPARRHANNDAYRLYLLGKQDLNQRTQNLDGAIAHFRQAVAIDSLSAEAWSGLSLALAISPFYQGASAPSVAPEAMASARRALKLDPTLAEPHIALGAVLGRSMQWDQSEAELKAALDIDPHDVEARVQNGSVLMARDKLVEGLREYQKARDVDPASSVVLGVLSKAWYLLGQMDSALVESDRAMERNPSLTTKRYRALILAAHGRKQEARRIAEKLPPGHPLVLYALAVAGDTAAARDGVRILSASSNKRWLEETAVAFGLLGLGDTTQALDAFERATDAKEPWTFVASASGRIFDGVRRSDRFRRLLTRIGLSEQR